MQGSSSVQATDQKNALHFATAKVWHVGIQIELAYLLFDAESF